MKNVLLRFSLLIPLIFLPLSIQSENSTFNTLYMGAAALGIAGVTYYAYGKYKDSQVDRQKVIYALEKAYNSLLKLEKRKVGKLLVKCGALCPLSVEKTNLIDLVDVRYKKHTYKYVAYCSDLDGMLHDLQKAKEVIEILRKEVEQVLNKKIAINAIDFFARKQVVKSFFYFDSFETEIEQGVQYYTQSIMQWYEESIGILDSIEEARKHLHDMALLLAELPEYQHEKRMWDKEQYEKMQKEIAQAQALAAMAQFSSCMRPTYQSYPVYQYYQVYRTIFV